MKRHVTEPLFTYILRCLWLIVLLGSPVWFAVLDTWQASIDYHQSMGSYYDLSGIRIIFFSNISSLWTWLYAIPAFLCGLWMTWHCFSIPNVITQVWVLGPIYLLPYLLFGF